MFNALRVSKQSSLASAARAFSTSRPRAADLAKLTLIGRIAKEPESRLTKNEKRFIAYTIVTSSGSTVQGERQWIPTYHRVLCFDNSQLDYLSRLRKGSRVYVQADYNIKEPEQGADPTTPQGQRHIFLTHDTLKVLTAPRPPSDAEETERVEQEEEDTSHLSQDRVF